jgi:hypothetical protein
MAKRTAADQFVEILLAAGVRRMYRAWPAETCATCRGLDEGAV